MHMLYHLQDDYMGSVTTTTRGPQDGAWIGCDVNIRDVEQLVHSDSGPGSSSCKAADKTCLPPPCWGPFRCCAKQVQLRLPGTSCSIS